MPAIGQLNDYLTFCSFSATGLFSQKKIPSYSEKIVDLYLKLMQVFNMKSTLNDIDFYLKDDISELDRCLKDTELHEYAKGIEINPNFAYNLPQKIEKFRKEIIQDFGQI